MREQGICCTCVSQQSYIDKLSRVFLMDGDQQFSSYIYPTTPMDTNAFDKLAQAEEEPDFEGPYRSIVGGLLYISVCMRIGVGFSLNSYTTFDMARPKPTHFAMAKRVLFYF